MSVTVSETNQVTEKHYSVIMLNCCHRQCLYAWKRKQ